MSQSDLPQYIKLQVADDGNAAAQMDAAVQRVLAGPRRQINEFSAEAKAQIDAALSVQRNQSGSLDLGVDQMRAAATAQQARVTAAREVAAALSLTAKEEKIYTAEMRQQIAAAKQVVVAEEAQEAALRSKVTVLEQVQERMNRQASATDAVVAAARRGTDAQSAVTNSVRSSRVAFVQLGQQMQDMVIQAQMGTSAITIFTQQVPQAAFALSGLGGKVGAVARAFSGPLGAAFIAVTALAGPLILKMIQGGDAADKLGDKTLTLTDALRTYGTATDEARKAIVEYNATQDRARDNAERMTQVNLALAESELKKALAVREALAAELARRDADLDPRNAPFGADEAYMSGVASARSYTQAKVASNDSKIAELAESARNLRIADAKRSAAAAVDPIKAINNLYDDMAARAEAAAASNDKLSRSLTATLTAIERQRKAALDAQRASTRENGATRARTQQQVLADFKGELAARGISVISDVRTAAEQNALFRRGATPLDGYKRPSRHQSGQAVDVDKRTHNDTLARAAAQAAGLRNFEIVTESGGRKHYEWSGAGRAGEVDVSGAERAAEQAARAQERLAEFGGRAAEQIQRLNEQFNDQPRLIDQSARATRELDAIIADLSNRKPPGFEKMIADAERAKGVVADAINRPFEQMEQASERRLSIQKLLAQGREDEAAALDEIYRTTDQVGDLTAEQEQRVRSMVMYEQQRTRELEKQRARLGNQLQQISGLRSNLVQTVLDFKTDGVGAFGNMFSRLQSQFENYFAETLIDNLFGDAFQSVEDQLRGAKQSEADVSLQTADAIAMLGNSATAAAQSLEAAFDRQFGGGAANDNGIAGAVNEITVVGQRLQDYSNPRRLFSMMGSTLLEGVVGKSAAKSIGSAVTEALQGSVYGNIGGGLIGNAGLGSSIGGILGYEGGKALSSSMSKAIGGSIGGAVGSILGPIGGIIGGIFGGLFKKSPSGTASVTNDSVSVRANKAQVSENLSGIGSGVQSSISQIARALGGTIGDYSVGLGQKDDYFQVSAVAGDPFLGKNDFWKKSSNDIYDGKDANAALSAAIKNAIEDGAIQGVRAGTQAILKAGKDIDQQVDKAIKFESVFTRLKEWTDPVGAALDALDKEFSNLKSIFGEAGASAAEYADLEKLYGLERAQAVKDAASSITASLKSLFDDLTIGDNGLSLRDRKSAAQAAYNPLAERVRAGDVSAFDDYATAARSLLDIERQMSGSQPAYFALLNEMTALTKTTIDGQTSIADLAANRDSPFSALPAANDNQALVDAISAMGYLLVGDLGAKLDAVNSNLGALIQQGIVSGAIVPNYYQPVNFF